MHNRHLNWNIFKIEFLLFSSKSPPTTFTTFDSGNLLPPVTFWCHLWMLYFPSYSHKFIWNTWQLYLWNISRIRPCFITCFTISLAQTTHLLPGLWKPLFSSALTSAVYSQHSGQNYFENLSQIMLFFCSKPFSGFPSLTVNSNLFTVTCKDLLLWPLVLSTISSSSLPCSFCLSHTISPRTYSLCSLGLCIWFLTLLAPSHPSKITYFFKHSTATLFQVLISSTLIFFSPFLHLFFPFSS